MSADRVIPLKAVSQALMCAVVRLKTKGQEVTGRPVGRFAAFTQVPHPFVYRCPDARRGHGLRKQIPWHFSPMEAGDMPAVLRRVRGHGLPEGALGRVARLHGDVAAGDEIDAAVIHAQHRLIDLCHAARAAAMQPQQRRAA